MNNNLEDFLKNITIDPSIKSIGQLYSKYEEVAKEFKLVIDGFQVEKDGSQVSKLLFFSLRMKGLGKNDDDAANLFLCYDRSKIGIIEKDDVYIDDYERTVYQVGKHTKKNLVITRDGTTKTREEEEEIYGWPLINTNTGTYKNKTNDPLYKKIIDKVSSPLCCYYGAIEPNAQARFLSYFFAVKKEDLSPVGLQEQLVGLQEQLDKLCSKAYEISAQIRNKHLSNLNVLLKRETVKSAKAAIMSRNMSHNLGSHVMFYIKQRLESVEKILDSGALKNLIQASSLDDLEKILKEVHINSDTKQMPFLVGLGRFINYLQERQDYIATVATDYIPYKTTINFKDAIYDELKPEMHARRHNGDAAGREAANLLLDYIAKSEGFEKSDDIVLLFGKGDGTTFDGSGTPEDVPESLRNFNVSLPGGNLGRQAFFSIMENIIRNTAKHDGSKSKKLVFQFDRLTSDDITDIEGFSYRYREIYEKEPRLNYSDKNCYKEFENDFEYLGITIKVKKEESELDDTINKINKGLTSKYLSNDGQMNDDYKGIKEIRLSAAWLRDEKLDFEMPMNQPPAVSIRKNNIDGVKYLQYVICLPKPKKIAIVSSSLQDAEEYHKQGCMVFKPDNLKGISDYELVVYDNNMEDDIFKKEIQPISGARVFAEKITDTIKSDIIEGKLDVLYDKWLEKAFQKDFGKDTSIAENVKLSIIDSKQKDTSSSENLKVTTDTATADEDYYANNIVFNTHYKGQAFSDNKALFAKARFVEAISGGNSTDRLIRHDKRTTEWYCKHIAAGMSNVAVFDERLYSIIIPQNWMDPLNTEDLVKKYFGDGNSFDANEYTRFMRKNLILTYDQASMLHEAFKDVKVNSISQEAVIRSSLLKDYSNTWKYREKGIWGFDICIEKDKGIVKIMGYNAAPTRGQIGLYDHKYRETCIAMIRKGERSLTQCVDGFAGKFDFISIHQGILDKIYDALGVKEDKEKEVVTKAIFDYFSCKKSEVVSLEGDKYYLPQFIIHSGRSKPNKKDMPQHLPFLQFSAIDHAVRDCKYTLTELLYSAHYEGE